IPPDPLGMYKERGRRSNSPNGWPCCSSSRFFSASPLRKSTSATNQRSPEGGSGRTMVIPVCNLLIYVLGPIALSQPPWVAIGVTVATVLVIGTRERMHSFARLIPQDEVLTVGKFLILVGIILPLVPDTRLIATAPVTPYHIWLAVIAISGLSYLTYLVQRYRPIKGGALLPALLGGAYSSTATTVVLAKRQREARTRRPELSAGIIAATAIMYPRLTVLVALFNLPLAARLLPTLSFFFIAGAVWAWWEWRKIEPESTEDLAIPAANPLQLTTALIFAGLFLAISLVTAWVESISQSARTRPVGPAPMIRTSLRIISSSVHQLRPPRPAM